MLIIRDVLMGLSRFDEIQKSSGSPVRLGFINTETNEGVDLNDVANAMQKYNLSYT